VDDHHHVDGTIELVLPADTRLVRVARLVASGIATAAGFDVEQVEDLRIAIDELCAALIEGGDSGPLLLSFEVGADQVSILGSTDSGPTAEFEPERLSLSRQILEVVVDEHEIGTDHGRINVRLVKRGGLAG
jgi:anti-sigma regulatory factor (Ser/Thr protein kinase)